MWFLDHLFARFRWYRRARGGHWEQWWIGPPVASTIVMQNQHGTRPGLGVVCDWCEDYSRPLKELPFVGYRSAALQAPSPAVGNASKGDE